MSAKVIVIRGVDHLQHLEPARVIREQRTVYRVPGGKSRFTRAAAYREAARVLIRASVESLLPGENSRFYGETIDGFAYNHPATFDLRAPGLFSEPGEAHGPKGEPLDASGSLIGDGGRGYYVLVRERLARWLRWADEVRDE